MKRGWLLWLLIGVLLISPQLTEASYSVGLKTVTTTVYESISWTPASGTIHFPINGNVTPQTVAFTINNISSASVVVYISATVSPNDGKCTVSVPSPITVPGSSGYSETVTVSTVKNNGHVGTYTVTLNATRY